LATNDLSPKQAKFVSEYLIDLNATQAAIRAGYSAKTADVQGPRLLGNVGVAAAIQEAQGRVEAKAEITQARVLTELALLAFSDLTHYVVDDNGDVKLAEGAPDGAMRALQSIKRKITSRKVGDEWETTRDVEIRLWDKPGPLKLAGRHVGLFADKVELTGPNGGPIETVTRVERVIVRPHAAD
jgi:phage terminase small subunit